MTSDGAARSTRAKNAPIELDAIAALSDPIGVLSVFARLDELETLFDPRLGRRGRALFAAGGTNAAQWASVPIVDAARVRDDDGIQLQREET